MQSIENTPDAVAFAEGQAKAKHAIATGCPVFRWHGHAGGWGHDFEELMSERFGIPVQFSGCFVHARLISFDDGYNTILKEHIDQEHGPGAFDAARSEAQRRRQERYDRHFGIEKNNH